MRNLTWEEFTGVTLSVSGGANQLAPHGGRYNVVPFSQFSGVGAGTLPGQAPTGLTLVPTTGTILSLRFGQTYKSPSRTTYLLQSVNSTYKSLLTW